LPTLGMVAPKFQQFLKSVLAEVGKDAVFECHIQGEPAPVIMWWVMHYYLCTSRLCTPKS